MIGARPPGGLAQARYLCEWLRAGVPGGRVVVGRWGVVEDAETARHTPFIVASTSLFEGLRAGNRVAFGLKDSADALLVGSIQRLPA